MLQPPFKPLKEIPFAHNSPTNAKNSINQSKMEQQSSADPKLSLPQMNKLPVQGRPERGQNAKDNIFQSDKPNANVLRKGQFVSLSLFKKSLGIQTFGMQVQKPKQYAKDSWEYNDPQHPHLKSKLKFITLNEDFKFRSTITLNQKKNVLQQIGELVFNNGSTVPISIGYICYFNTELNQKGSSSAQKVAYSVDLSSQTLTFSVKMSGVKTVERAQKWIAKFEEQVLSRKDTIINLLAVIGIQMDIESKIIRQINKFKKILKNKIEQLFKNQNNEGESISNEDIESQPLTHEQSNEQSSREPIIYFGGETNNKIERSENQEKLEGSRLKIEGGYFIIQSFNYDISLNNGPTVTKTLCRKTLRQKRQIDPKTREQNQLKMHKQLQIISKIKNKEYLIQYYCQDTKNLEYLLMEQYNSSLQEYIYFFGDALCITHKINIARQLVQAVINLHDSGIIHRDLKPSNILLKDSKYEPSGYTIKIIDYAQSYSDKVKDYGTEYACSHPYSPIECGVARGSDNFKEGVENKEIDYWSVGITLYEVFFRKLPVSFSRPFLTDIKLSWKSQLILIVNQRQKYGLALVDDIITMICIKMMKMDQKKRMKLHMARRLLQFLNEYVLDVMSLIQ